VRDDNDSGLKILRQRAEDTGYVEDPGTRVAREALEGVLAEERPDYNSINDTVIDALERYNDGPEFASRTTASKFSADVIWVGSRIMLDRSYLRFDLFGQAADALEDAILTIQGSDNDSFDPRHLAILQEIKSDLRDWAGVPGLV
jgi:hypothetical protein